MIHNSWNYIIDSYRMQLENIRAQSIFKNLRFKVWLDGILYIHMTCCIVSTTATTCNLMVGGHADPLRTQDLRLCKVEHDVTAGIVSSTDTACNSRRPGHSHSLRT